MRVVMGVIVLLTGASACSGLKGREAVAVFNPTATQAEHQAALAACAHASPNASPEPMVVSRYAATNLDNVRFRIDRASDADLQRLEACLGRQPGVIGVNIPEQG